jgi:O-antigen/teichoic acid export membrane protein
VTLPTISTEAILLSLGRTKNAALFEIVTKTAMILSVALAALFGQQLTYIFKALIVYGFAQMVFGVWMVWKPVRRMKSRLSFSELKSQITFAAPYGLSSAVGMANCQLDKFLVALFFTPTVFAIYSAGAFEIPLAGVTAVPVVSVLIPEFSKKFESRDIKGIVNLWHESMLKVSLLVFAVAAFLLVFAKPAVTTLFSSKYEASVWPFRIYLLFLPLRITVFGQVLVSLGETRFIFISQTIAAIVNIVLGYTLVQTLGWYGAAISAVASGYLFSALLVNKICKKLDIGIDRILPWQSLSKVGLIALFAAVISLPVSLLQMNGIWMLCLGFSIFAAVYIIGNLATGSIKTTDFQTLRRWLLLRFEETNVEERL